MVGAHGDPAGVGRDVVDPVGVGLAQVGVGEVVVLDPGRFPGRSPLASGVLVLPDELLFLGVDADHRLTGRDVRSALVIEVGELGIPVDVGAALDRFDVALQAESLLAQQVRHRPRRDPVPAAGQLLSQGAGGLDGPTQRRARVTALVRLDQAQQRLHQPQVRGCQGFASRARTAHPVQRFVAGLELAGSLGHRDRADPSRPCHDLDPAVTQNPCLRAHRQTTLALI